MRDFKNFKDADFLQDCFDCDWYKFVYSHTDVNKMYNSFSKVFSEICEKHAPFKDFPTTNKKNIKKPWITNDLRVLMQKKDYIFKQSLNSPLNTRLREKFKTYRNLVTKKIKISQG